MHIFNVVLIFVKVALYLHQGSFYNIYCYAYIAIQCINCNIYAYVKSIHRLEANTEYNCIAFFHTMETI